MENLKNYRMIKVNYVSPTNERGSRIKIYETARYNDQKTESKTFSYDYVIGDVQRQGFDVLKRNGFKVVCTASDKDNYIFLCDNWADDFLKISDLK